MLTPALAAKGKVVSRKVAALRDLVGAAQLGDLSEPLLGQLDLTLRAIEEDMEGVGSRPCYEEEQVLDQVRRRQQALAAEWNVAEVYGDPKEDCNG
jgi:hypothetical protein